MASEATKKAFANFLEIFEKKMSGPTDHCANFAKLHSWKGTEATIKISPKIKSNPTHPYFKKTGSKCPNHAWLGQLSLWKSEKHVYRVSTLGFSLLYRVPHQVSDFFLLIAAQIQCNYQICQQNDQMVHPVIPFVRRKIDPIQCAILN